MTGSAPPCPDAPPAAPLLFSVFSGHLLRLLDSEHLPVGATAKPGVSADRKH